MSSDYNLAVIILFRESHGKQKSRIGMGLDKPSTADYQRSCHDAARDMIKHIHRIFKLAPSLRRWSYYCFYCLQATLVLLTKLVTDGNVPSLDPHTPPSEHYVREDSAEDLSCCELAIQVFQQIDLKASKHCAEVVRRFLEEWTVQIRRKSSRVSTYDQQATTLQENNRNKSHNSNEFVDAGQPIQYWQIPKSNSDPQLDSPKLHPYPASSMEDESFEPFEWQKNVDRSSGGLGPLPFEGADFAGMPSAVDLNSDDTIDFDAAGPATLPILAGLQTELYGALHSSDYDGYNGAFTRPSFPFGQSHGQRWRIGHEKFTWP